MGVMRPLQGWLQLRRMRKLLDLPLDRFPSGDAPGAAWSWYLLARSFDNRTGMRKDAVMAFRCYLRSAQAGLAVGQICARLAYRTGTGTPMDLVAAKVWWQAAAAQGDPGGEVLLEIQDE